MGKTRLNHRLLGATRTIHQLVHPTMENEEVNRGSLWTSHDAIWVRVKPRSALSDHLIWAKYAATSQ